MSAIRPIQVDWSQLPDELPTLRNDLPRFDVFVVPGRSQQCLIAGTPFSAPNGEQKLSTTVIAAPLGQGQQMTPGFGLRCNTTATHDSRSGYFGVALFYVNPASPDGTITFGHNSSRGAGVISVNISSTLVVSVIEPDFGASVVYTVAGYDPRGKTTSLAVSCKSGGGSRVLRVSVNGEPADGASLSDGSALVRGAQLIINDGNGFTGWSGALLYAGQGWFGEPSAAGTLPGDSTLQALSTPFAPFEPQRIWVPVSAGGSTTYTLSAPTYVPGSITSTGLTARVTVTAA